MEKNFEHYLELVTEMKAPNYKGAFYEKEMDYHKEFISEIEDELDKLYKINSETSKTLEPEKAEKVKAAIKKLKEKGHELLNIDKAKEAKGYENIAKLLDKALQQRKKSFISRALDKLDLFFDEDSDNARLYERKEKNKLRSRRLFSGFNE